MFPPATTLGTHISRKPVPGPAEPPLHMQVACNSREYKINTSIVYWHPGPMLYARGVRLWPASNQPFLNPKWPHNHAPITPNFPSGSGREIVGDYVEKWMLAHHFSHYHKRRFPKDGVRTGRCDQPLSWENVIVYNFKCLGGRPS